MKIYDMINSDLDLKRITNESGLDKEVDTVYICDVLSHVMSSIPLNSVWITIHNHINIVAVAEVSEVGCIIIAEGIMPEEGVAEKAMKLNIPIFSTNKTAYEISRELYHIGL